MCHLLESDNGLIFKKTYCNIELTYSVRTLHLSFGDTVEITKIQSQVEQSTHFSKIHLCSKLKHDFYMRTF